MNNQKTIENRLLGAVAHASVVTQGIGILVGVLVYLTQQDKSRATAFQGLQAAVFQLVNLIITIVLWVAWGFFYGLSMIPLLVQAEANPDAAPPAIFWIAMLTMVFPLIYMLLVGLIGLWGALRTWQGEDFKYPLIGGWLEKVGLGKAAPPAEQPS